MFNKLFDSIIKIFGFFKTSYIIFLITLVIVHFTLNLSQKDFSEVLDSLLSNEAVNVKFLSILDSIFYNCAFFSLNIGVVCFSIKSYLKIDDIQSNEYKTLSKALDEIKNYFKISLSVFYFIHIILNFKLFITDFLFTLCTMLSEYHFIFLSLTFSLTLIFSIFRFIKKKFS